MLSTQPTGPAFGRPDDKLRDEAIHSFLGGEMDCFAEPVIGRAFARPVGCVPSMIGSLEVKVFYPA